MPGVPPKAIGPRFKRDMVPTLFPPKVIYITVAQVHDVSWRESRRVLIFKLL